MTDLTRARLTAQHAHAYHRTVLNIADRLREHGRNSTGSFGALNSLGKEMEHKGEGLEPLAQMQKFC